MSLDMLFFGIMPVVFYVVVDARYGLKAGIYAAIASVFVVIAWLFWKTREIDYFVLFDAALICGLGLLSLRLNNPRYFKFQPFVISGILALYTGYFQLFSEPLLIHYIPMVKQFSEPEQAAILDSPIMREAFATISGQLAILFAIHAVFCAVAALRWSNVMWMLTRLSIYPAMLILVVSNLVRLGVYSR